MDEDAGIVGQVIVATDTAVYHFGLLLLPVPHVQMLQQFSLLNDMTNVARVAMWGVSPTLLTQCAAGLVAVDLTFHRFRVTSGSLEERVTQVIEPDGEYSAHPHS